MQDRFAEGRFIPAIDDSQDWILEFGEQENGYTILAFSRPLTSCDPNDLNIKVCSKIASLKCQNYSLWIK